MTVRRRLGTLGDLLCFGGPMSFRTLLLICIYIYMYVCMHVCMYIYIYVYTVLLLLLSLWFEEVVSSLKS